MASKLSVADTAFVRAYGVAAGIKAKDIEAILNAVKTAIEAILTIMAMMRGAKVRSA